MPQIEINTCDNVSSYDALEGVTKFVVTNYIKNDYLTYRIVEVSSGCTLSIRERYVEDAKEIANIRFDVHLLHKKEK